MNGFIRRFSFFLLIFSFANSCVRHAGSEVSSAPAATRLKGVEGGPTFQAMTQWAGQFRVANGAAIQNTYSLNDSLIKTQLPAAELLGAGIYLDKELQRVASYRQLIAQKNQGEISKLLEQESKETYDLIMVMLFPADYTPQYGGLFATFAKVQNQNSESNLLDHFAQGFLVDQVANQIGAFGLIANDLETERNEYVELLKKQYFADPSGLTVLDKDLEAKQLSLTTLATALKSGSTTTQYDLRGLTAAFLHFQTASFSMPASKKRSYGASPFAPSDEYLFYEPTTSDGTYGTRAINVADAKCPSGLVTASCSAAQNICLPKGLTCANNHAQITAPWWNTYSGITVKNTSAPTIRYNCAAVFAINPQGRIVCERHTAFEAPLESEKGAYDSSSQELTSALRQFAGKSSNFIMTDFETPVQDQGHEGACTAYGATHTLEAQVNQQLGGFGFTSSANELWRTYETPDMSAAEYAAENFDFDDQKGTKVKLISRSRLQSITALLQQLQKGPVWAASQVNDSWHNSSSGTDSILACEGSIVGGHSYSIHGFKVNKEGTAGVLYIKNSWGKKYGDRGFVMMPLKCLDSDSLDLRVYVMETKIDSTPLPANAAEGVKLLVTNQIAQGQTHLLVSATSDVTSIAICLDKGSECYSATNQDNLRLAGKTNSNLNVFLLDAPAALQAQGQDVTIIGWDSNKKLIKFLPLKLSKI